jgi:uncharacterized protein (TIGR03437 family)
LVPAIIGRPSCTRSEYGEWQLTFSPISHNLDNNDNFSLDDMYLAYDTRDTVGSGIGNGTWIAKVNVMSGLETVVYKPESVVDPTNAAPGLGAVSFSPVEDKMIFIHGPLLSEVAARGYYGKTNRTGGIVPGDGSGTLQWADMRDVTNTVTTPGAMRGGTHRHEYTADGSRIGFTYDDFFLTQYGRTIGFMVPNAKKPASALYYATLLVKTVPTAGAKTGDIVQADSDSWVGRKGLMRAFVGKTLEANGSYVSSLYVVDIPANIDVTTADSGTKTVYPTPAKGLTIRRLTHTPAGGTVRGSLDGKYIAYYAPAADGTTQLFIINSQGSDQSSDPAMRPKQLTFMPGGIYGGVRWHPSGNSVGVIMDNGVAVICVKDGPLFGATRFITSHGDGKNSPDALVWARNGNRLAYVKRTVTYDSTGKLAKDVGGNDFKQIWLVDFPDCNGNGVADMVEDGVIKNIASYSTGMGAPESLATFVAPNIATKTTAASTDPMPTTLEGASVQIVDAKGVKRPSLLKMTSAEQINFVLPAGMAAGTATAIVRTPNGGVIQPDLKVDAVYPGIFTADSSGAGVALADAERISSAGKSTAVNVYQVDATTGAVTAVPIDLGIAAGDSVYLKLYATGVRGYETSVAVTIGGVAADLPAVTAEPATLGLDSIRVKLPAALAGKGSVVVAVTVDGKKANTTLINIK